MHEVKFGFEETLAPMSPEEFFAEYWERKPLIIRRNNPAYHRDLLSAKDMDTLLAQSRPRFPQLRMVRSGLPFPYDRLESGGWLHPPLPSHIADAKMSAVADGYADGYTIIVEMEKLWQPVTALTRSMEQYLHHKSTAEVYMTPRGSQGFELHYDHHEVFLLQLEGAKHWEVYSQIVDAPMADQQISKDDVSGPPLLDDVLYAGDLLYIPRGAPHQGKASECFSLHITFGVFTYRWQNLLVEALKEIAEGDERFRASLPVGFLNANGARGEMKSRMRELFFELAEHCDFDSAVERIGVSLVRKMDPLPDGHFEQINLLPQLRPESSLVKREGALCLVSVRNGSASITYPGNYVNGPSWLEPAFRFIAGARSFLVSEIPELEDDQSRLVLARRLVREGLLRIEKL